MFTFFWENKFLIGQSTNIFSVKTGFEELKKSKQTWWLIFWSYGSYLPFSRRWKYETNGTIIQLESLQSLLHMLTDEHLTLIVQQNLGPRVIGIKVHLRQSKGTLALWKPIRNTKLTKSKLGDLVIFLWSSQKIWTLVCSNGWVYHH